MKILAIADIHGDASLSKKVGKIAKKEKVDMILVAGDQTWFSRPAKGIIKPFENHETLMIHGNHESEDLIKKFEEVYPFVKNMHKKHHTKEDVGFFGSGTTDWGFKEDSRQVFQELKKGHDKIKDLNKKVMIAHCPPDGSQIEKLGFPGSYGVRQAIDKFQPDFVVCGHIHEGGGLVEKFGKTKVLNVARRPMIFEI